MTYPPLHAANVLDPNWIPEYETQRDAIFTQLRELNTMMFILEKIEMFPFWLFAPNTHDYVFWRTTRAALIETTLMIASRTIVEGGGDSLTLRNFKRDIVMNTQDDQTKQQVIARLGIVDFDKRIRALEGTVRDIRNNFLAHLDKIQQMMPPHSRTIPNLTFSEMQSLIEAAFDLFNALSFDSYYVPWLHEYRDEVRNAQQTDVERLLDHVAKSSFLLNLPESDPEVWERRRLKLSPEEIELLNQYRRKFDLPEVA